MLLSHGHIQSLIKRGGHNDNLTAYFAGVNGHDVTNITQIFSPEQELLEMLFPPNITEAAYPAGYDPAQCEKGNTCPSKPSTFPSVPQHRSLYNQAP